MNKLGELGRPAEWGLIKAGNETIIVAAIEVVGDISRTDAFQFPIESSNVEIGCLSVGCLYFEKVVCR